MPHLIETFLCCSYDIQYREAGSGRWKNLVKETEDAKIYFVNDLLPKTYYVFRLSLIYPQSSVPYIWPPDERFAYESLGKDFLSITSINCSFQRRKNYIMKGFTICIIYTVLFGLLNQEGPNLEGELD